jgi:hypothetical protein
VFDSAVTLGYSKRMLQRRTLAILLPALFACSGAGSGAAAENGLTQGGGAGAPTQSATPSTPQNEDDEPSAPAGETAAGELAASAESAGLSPAAASGTDATEAEFAVFSDTGTGFTTGDVYDADREIVRFDTGLGAMVSGATGDAVGGWSVRGTDLSWTGSGVAFQVRFGSEGGERRAYFTETGRGTICNLRLSGPGVLSISGTNETPPAN